MDKPNQQSTPNKINLWYAGIALLLLMLFQSWWVSQRQTTAKGKAKIYVERDTGTTFVLYLDLTSLMPWPPMWR
jgi:hypothetical protein